MPCVPQCGKWAPLVVFIKTIHSIFPHSVEHLTPVFIFQYFIPILFVAFTGDDLILLYSSSEDFRAWLKRSIFARHLKMVNDVFKYYFPGLILILCLTCNSYAVILENALCVDCKQKITMWESGRG